MRKTTDCKISDTAIQTAANTISASKRRSFTAGDFLQISFVIGALTVLAIFSKSEQIITLGILFVAIVLEALPFMLIGTLISGAIEVFIPKQTITKFLPQRTWLNICIGAGLGIMFPVCECAIVPIVRRLLRKGVPLGGAVAYLLAGPIFNPVVAASTFFAYSLSWKIMLIRLFCGYIIAVTAGFLMDFFFTRTQALLPEINNFATDENHNHTHQKHNSIARRFSETICHAADEFFDVTRFLIIGAFFAAMLQTIVSQSFFADIMVHPMISIIIMMILAVSLNLCSEADAFIAASFRSTPVPFVAQLAFMVLGPMLDIKLILMYMRMLKLTAVIALAATTFLLTLGTMFIAGIFL